MHKRSNNSKTRGFATVCLKVDGIYAALKANSLDHDGSISQCFVALYLKVTGWLPPQTFDQSIEYLIR